MIFVVCIVSAAVVMALLIALIRSVNLKKVDSSNKAIRAAIRHFGIRSTGAIADRYLSEFLSAGLHPSFAEFKDGVLFVEFEGFEFRVSSHDGEGKFEFEYPGELPEAMLQVKEATKRTLKSLGLI